MTTGKQINFDDLSEDGNTFSPLKLKRHSNITNYAQIIQLVFEQGYAPHKNEILFYRTDIEAAAKSLNIRLSNPSDVPHSFLRYGNIPQAIQNTSTNELKWTIVSAGSGAYRFVQRKIYELKPSSTILPLTIPDATPKEVLRVLLNDEQSFLLRMRNSKLLDDFYGCDLLHVGSHRRTSIKSIGQHEIDDMYVGKKLIIPVQAKMPREEIMLVQTHNDILYCRAQYHRLECRATVVKLISKDYVAIFEVQIAEDGEMNAVKEKHYVLQPPILR